MSSPPDRLEEEWRILRDAIKYHETELAAMKKQFEILDNARAVLIMRSMGAKMPNALTAQKQKLGLRDAVLKAIVDSEMGIGLPDLCGAVALRVDSERYASERSLEAAVQTTVRRLIAQGVVALHVRSGVRKYVQGPNAHRMDEDKSGIDRTRDAE